MHLFPYSYSLLRNDTSRSGSQSSLFSDIIVIEQLEPGRQGTYDKFQCTMYSVQHLMVPRLVYGILNIGNSFHLEKSSFNFLRGR